MDSASLELNLALCLGEQGVVLAHAYIGTSEELCPALGYNNRTGLNDLAGVLLYTAILRITIASVPG